jgi:hypothetical protein
MSNLEPPIPRSGTGIFQGAVDFLHIHQNWPFVTPIYKFVICGLVGSGAAQRGKPRASNFLASLDVDDIIWSLLDESDQLPRP